MVCVTRALRRPPTLMHCSTSKVPGLASEARAAASRSERGPSEKEPSSQKASPSRRSAKAPLLSRSKPAGGTACGDDAASPSARRHHSVSCSAPSPPTETRDD